MDGLNGSRVAVALVAALALAGCGRLGLNDSSSSPSYEPLPPAPAAPSASVTSDTLQPLPPVPGQPGPSGSPPVAGGPAPSYPAYPDQTPGQPAPPPLTSAPAPDRAMTISKAQFAGGWSLGANGETCQLFTNLTSWSGGMRAIAKGCSSPDLQRISAWNLEGKQVVLKSADGSVVASLYANSPEQFSGVTAARQPITLSR